MMADATLLLDQKKTYEDGAVLQLKLWRLPESSRVRGSTHGFKYSLYYGTPGVRLVSYDNEAGKGDHVHRGSSEGPYTFVSPQQLVDDFLNEVRRLRGGQI